MSAPPPPLPMLHSQGAMDGERESTQLCLYHVYHVSTLQETAAGKILSRKLTVSTQPGLSAVNC